MNLRHLRYFMALAEALNFRRAAERLHISQPALSRQIQVLERELGIELLERTAQGSRLTEAGRTLARDAGQIIDALEQAGERAKRVARGQSGTLRVGLSETGAVHDVVRACLHQFRNDRPDVELVISGMDSITQLESLHKDRIDVGFVVGYGQDDKDIDHLLLQRQSVLLVVPEDHRLALADKVTLSQLQDEPLIWTSRSANHYLYDSLKRACLAGGLTPRIVQEVSPGTIVLCLVSIGMGLGFVVSEMPWRQPRGIVRRRIEDLAVSLDLHLVWHREKSPTVAAHFIEIAAAMAP
jgi:DNA-binding transcriptional LysR family regulator